MKKILLGALLIVSCFAFGQKIKLKDDKVYVDDKECLKHESKNMGTINSFSNLTTGDKLFYVDYKDAGSRLGYVKIGFTGTDNVITLSSNHNRKDIIKSLIEEKVLENCKINFDNIKNFINRYNQHYEESIIR